MILIKGQVVNKIKGFYYVNIGETTLECHLRGILKKTEKKENCVVGDIVEVNSENFITNIYPRKNLLLRPVVANIDYLVIQFAGKDPVIDYERLHLLIMHSFFNNIKPVVVINKIDLLTPMETEEIKDKLIYLKKIDIPIFFISTISGVGISDLEKLLMGSLTAFGGPSGVGKSSIINFLQNKKELKTGETSARLKRGKHTTRDSNLLPMSNGGFIIDTPGFSSLEYPDVKNVNELISLFPEFTQGISNCKFSNCIHINEPQCGVKSLVENGEISETRYHYYKKAYDLLKNNKWKKF